MQSSGMSMPGIPISLSKRGFIPFNEADLTLAEVQAVSDVLLSGWLGNGRVAREFENKFSYHMGGMPCVAVNSCTMGLVLALRAENIGLDDEVITTPLTFAATINAILMVGARPVLVDVGDDGLIDPQEIKKVLRKSTKAIIPVHLWGQPCKMKEITMLAHEHGVLVIEDAAHAFGGIYEGNPLGSVGDYGVFSFYPTKNITCGDGGMIVCRKEDKIEKIRMLAAQGLDVDSWSRYGQGKARDYSVIFSGYKASMNDVAAVIGFTQLQRWSELRNKRARIWMIYEEIFGRKMKGHSHHIYEIRIDKRQEFRDELSKLGVGTGIHYKPLHFEVAYKFLGYKEGSFPKAEEIGKKTVSLPISSKMTREEAFYVCDSVNKIKGELHV